MSTFSGLPIKFSAKEFSLVGTQFEMTFSLKEMFLNKEF